MKVARNSEVSLREIGLLFLKLGTIAFGGPAAHIALMKEDVVERRRWLSEEKFLDYLSAANLIPGPNSTELAIHIGYHLRGFPGLLVAGSCFIIPAMLIVWSLAWTYVTYGALPEVALILYGIKPVVIAIVLYALWGLTRSAVKSANLGVLAILALALNLSGLNEIAVLVLSGVLALFMINKRPRPQLAVGAILSSLATKSFATTALAKAATSSLSGLFMTFVKIGSVLFGSGYVLLAFLRADFVERLRWLTEAQLLDAVAVGQFTPGPVFTTATFIGYLIAGNAGALLATLGIFLPAFFFVAVSAPLIPKLRQSPRASAFLDGVNVASLALMASVSWQLGRTTLVDLTSIVLTLLAGVALLRYKINSAWLIIAGAAVGALSKFI